MLKRLDFLDRTCCSIDTFDPSLATPTCDIMTGASDAPNTGAIVGGSFMILAGLVFLFRFLVVCWLGLEYWGTKDVILCLVGLGLVVGGLCLCIIQ